MALDITRLATAWLADRGEGAEEAALCAALAPVLTKSAEDRDAWLRCWALAADLRAPTAATLLTSGQDLPVKTQNIAADRRRGPRRRTIVALAALVALLAASGIYAQRALVWLGLEEAWEQGRSFVSVTWEGTAEQVLSDPRLLAAGGSTVIAILAAFVLWPFVARNLRRAEVPSTRALSGLIRSTGVLDGLWDDTFRSVSKDLRRLGAVRRPTNRRRLDVRATVEATARQRGVFKPVYRPVEEAPHYVFIIALEQFRDHGLGEAARLTASFRRTGVASEAFFWRPGTGVLAPERGVVDPDLRPRPMDFAQLWSRHPDSTLVLVAEPSVLLDPLSRRARAGLGILENWHKRVLISRSAPEPGFEALAVSQLGLRTAILSFAHPKAMIEAIAGRDTPSCRAPGLRSPPPALDVNRLDAWEIGDLGPAAWANLKRALAQWLGPAGLSWLGATAALPFLSWEFTMTLGRLLHDADGLPLYTETRAHSLLSLPWFRKGFLPPALRARLLDDLDTALAAQVRTVIRELQRGGTAGGFSRSDDVAGLPAASLGGIGLPNTNDPATSQFFRRQGGLHLGLDTLRGIIAELMADVLSAFSSEAQHVSEASKAQKARSNGSWAAFWTDVLWHIRSPLPLPRPDDATQQVLRTYFFKGAGAGDIETRGRAFQALFEVFTSTRHAETPAVHEALGVIATVLNAVRVTRGQVSERGVYVWGPAGWGKSALMRAAALSNQISRRAILSFPMLLTGLGALVEPQGGRRLQPGDIAPRLRARRAARWVAREIRLLCIDDISAMPATTAILLREFLATLRREGVTVLMSSQLRPKELAPGPAGERLAEFIDRTAAVMQLSDLDQISVSAAERPELSIFRDLRRHQQLLGETSVAVGKTYLEMADLRFAKHEFDQAEIYLRRAIQLFEMNEHSDLLLLSPLQKLGQALAAQGRSDEAVAVLERALRATDRQTDPDGEIEYRLCVDLANTLTTAGRLADAVAVFNRAIAALRLVLDNPLSSADERDLKSDLEAFQTTFESAGGGIRPGEILELSRLPLARSVLSQGERLLKSEGEP